MTIPLLRAPKPGDRTAAQLWEQYQVEKELAAKLYNASPLERRKLYSSAYDELFRRIPHHGQLTRKLSPEQRAQYVSLQLRLLGRFLKPSTTLLEIGAGDCSLSLQVASRVRKVYALDVSNFITQGIDVPDNFELILSNGVSVPVPAGSITLAYSNQLMEHLHPEDAAEQLTNIFNAIAPGGAYVCITPNRLTGPHDISRYFDNVAKGFHLKEYTVAELRQILRDTGFRRTVQYARLRGAYLPIPAWFTRFVEGIWAALPPAMRANAWCNRMARSLLGIWLVAWK
jgi:cyclopropane fatty-acyl-phospholipid synthase-like methyltransferase